MTAAAPNATTTSKSYKKTAVKEKRLGEKASLSFFKNTLLFLTMLGLHCCSGFSLVLVSRGYSLVAGHRPLIEMASLLAEHGLSSCSS